jgi:hypothetical protein
VLRVTHVEKHVSLLRTWRNNNVFVWYLQTFAAIATRVHVLLQQLTRTAAALANLHHSCTLMLLLLVLLAVLCCRPLLVLLLLLLLLLVLEGMLPAAAAAVAAVPLSSHKRLQQL